jgi:hypothetical protein
MPGWLLALIVLATVYAVAVLALIQRDEAWPPGIALLLPNLMLFCDSCATRAALGRRSSLAIGIVLRPRSTAAGVPPGSGAARDAVVAALVLRHRCTAQRRGGAGTGVGPDTLSWILRGAGAARR